MGIIFRLSRFNANQMAIKDKKFGIVIQTWSQNRAREKEFSRLIQV